MEQATTNPHPSLARRHIGRVPERAQDFCRRSARHARQEAQGRLRPGVSMKPGIERHSISSDACAPCSSYVVSIAERTNPVCPLRRNPPPPYLADADDNSGHAPAGLSRSWLTGEVPGRRQGSTLLAVVRLRSRARSVAEPAPRNRPWSARFHRSAGPEFGAHSRISVRTQSFISHVGGIQRMRPVWHVDAVRQRAQCVREMAVRVGASKSVATRTADVDHGADDQNCPSSAEHFRNIPERQCRERLVENLGEPIKHSFSPMYSRAS
jgi:hypothetical protein